MIMDKLKIIDLNKRKESIKQAKQKEKGKEYPRFFFKMQALTEEYGITDFYFMGFLEQSGFNFLSIGGKVPAEKIAEKLIEFINDLGKREEVLEILKGSGIVGSDND